MIGYDPISLLLATCQLRHLSYRPTTDTKLCRLIIPIFATLRTTISRSAQFIESSSRSPASQIPSDNENSRPRRDQTHQLNVHLDVINILDQLSPRSLHSHSPSL